MKSIAALKMDLLCNSKVNLNPMETMQNTINDFLSFIILYKSFVIFMNRKVMFFEYQWVCTLMGKSLFIDHLYISGIN